MIWAGLAAVIIQRASAVWAAAVLALATDPSSLHPAVIADVMESPTWEQRGMGRGGAEREKQQTENRKGLLLSCSGIAISRAKQCIAGRGLPVQRTCVVLLFLRIEHICPLGVPGSVRGQPVGVRPGLMSPGSLSHLQKTGSAIIHSRIHTSSFLYLPYRQTERTTGSWRPSELCLSLSCGGQLGFFFGAKVSSCVRSSMDLTITSNEPIR